MPMPSNVLSTVDESKSPVPTIRARSEYRSIVDHDDYQDLCTNNNNNEVHTVTEVMPHYTKPPKVRYTTTTTPWSVSLESITEEEEDASGDRRRQEEDSSSESTYATYINDVNESPKIYHAGRVWCITKSRHIEPPVQQHAGYLETNIDDVNEHQLVHDQTFHRYKFDDAVLMVDREMEAQNPVLAVMPTPSYLLQVSKHELGSSNGWVETFSSTIIIQPPDISPTIHLEKFPIESEICETENTATFAENQEVTLCNEGFLETDIDNVVMPIKQEEGTKQVDEEIEDKIETPQEIDTHVENTEKHVNGVLSERKDGDKTKSQKGKKFMDKFRRSDSSETKDKTKKKKGKKSKRRKGKKDERDPFDIDDDEDFTTLHDSDEEDEEEAEEGGNCENTTENAFVVEVTTNAEDEPEIHPSNIEGTENQPSHTAEPEHQTPLSTSPSHGSKRPERSSVRLLCCQAPRMRPSSADSVKSGPYLASVEQTSKRQSNVTEITELIGNSSEDDGHISGPEFINGIELQPGQLNFNDNVEDQTNSVVIDSIATSDNPKAYYSIRPSSYEFLEESPISSTKDEIQFKIPIASSEDDGFDDDELSFNGSLIENGNIIKPKGYAEETTHAFYLIGTPGNVIVGDDVTQQIHSKPNQATHSNDMCTEHKQIHSNLDKKTVIPPQSSIYNHTPLLAQKQSAFNTKQVEDENEPAGATQNPRSTKYGGEIELGSDSLEILSDTKQERPDRIKELLTEFKQDVRQDVDDKQDEVSITKHEEEKPSQLSARVITVAKLDPIVATKQPDTNEIPHVRTPDSETFDKSSIHSDASERASLVITEQRARVRESLSKLNLPDWYKRSKYHRKVLNDELNVDYPDYASEPRIMSCSPTAGGSDWSMDSTGTGSSVTKLSFISEARYRRAYHNYDRYYKSFSSADRPIRTAFSCAELPRGTYPYPYDAKDPRCEIQAEAGEKYHSSDALLSVDDEPLIDKKSSSVLQSSPHHTSTPNLSPGRNRSRSMGDSYKKTPKDCNLSALSIRRLERETNDAVFYITGKVDGKSAPELVSPGDDSGFNDSYEPPRETRYEIKEAYIRPTDLQTTKESPVGDARQGVKNSYKSPPSKPPRISESEKVNVSNENHIQSKGIGPSSEPKSYQFVPITLAQDEVTQTFQSNLSHQTPKQEETSTPRKSESTQIAPTIRPDPRYKPDGSRNEKVTPFPMVTPSKNEVVSSSPAGSPSRRQKCNVQITITDTSLDEEPIPILSANTPNDTPHDPIPRPKSPIDFDEFRESNFAAVLSVVTSSKPKNTLGKHGNNIKPPPEVSMEEIVDSLLGLSSTSRSPSRNELQDADSYAKTARQGSVPEINWSSLSDQQQLSSAMNKSSSLDSLFSDEGLSPLNSIIIRNDEEEEELSGSSKESTPRLPRDIIGNELVMVKCSYRKCEKVKELEEARKSYKTCHNCYTYYCSRECRLAHWEKHKKKCVYSRINSAAKHVIYNSRYNEDLQNDLSRIARTGYLSRGRGAILFIFPDVDSAESYMTFGMEGLPFPPTYSTIRDLENSGLFGDHLNFLIQMCRTYDPDVKFVLNVAIMASGESSSKTRPRKQAQSIKKCAKVRLSMMHTQARQLPSKDRETLILTAPSGVSSEGLLDKKSRQICFIHIQRQLRQRGVSLRHQHSDVYDQLCRWVEYHDHFTPVTIYPREGGTGPRFMCVLMPDSDPNDFGWIDNPQLLDSIDLDAELDKLEDVVSSATATKL
ncbi:uncharacterized protein [Amphiura filiformis]|uniref:uncharacterized protein n=1 Tax=Amphiura filiformis TaxID=82378 RepID=UPI003B2106F0